MRNVTRVEKSSFSSSDQRYSGYSRNDALARVPELSAKDSQYINKWFTSQWQIGKSYDIACKWEPLREQILMQWARLSSREVDEAGPNRNRIALLIHNRYGINPRLVENYLRNFERVLPLA